jgi:hypothetical protein
MRPLSKEKSMNIKATLTVTAAVVVTAVVAYKAGVRKGESNFVNVFLESADGFIAEHLSDKKSPLT